jgi:hypothetical protein
VRPGTSTETRTRRERERERERGYLRYNKSGSTWVYPRSLQKGSLAEITVAGFFVRSKMTVALSLSEKTAPLVAELMVEVRLEGKK